MTTINIEERILLDQINLKSALLPNVEELIKTHSNDPEIAKHQKLILWSLLKIIDRVEELNQDTLEVIWTRYLIPWIERVDK